MSVLRLKPGQEKYWMGKTWKLEFPPSSYRSRIEAQIRINGSITTEISVSLLMYVPESRYHVVRHYGGLQLLNCGVICLSEARPRCPKGEHVVVFCKIKQQSTSCGDQKIGHFDSNPVFDATIRSQELVPLFEDNFGVCDGLFSGTVFEEDEFTDVEIHFEEKVFHCHAIVLMRRSSVWKTELTSDMKEKETRKIDAYDEHFRKEHFEAFMMALYNPTKLVGCNADAPAEHLMDWYTIFRTLCAIYRLADKYNVQDLISAVPKFFEITDIDKKNVCEVMNLAHSFNIESLFKQCIDEFPQVTPEFYQSEAWLQLVAAKPDLRFMLKSLGKIE